MALPWDVHAAFSSESTFHSDVNHSSICELSPGPRLRWPWRRVHMTDIQFHNRPFSQLRVKPISWCRRCTVYVVAVLCAACDSMNAVRIDPASAPDHPVFVLASGLGEQGPPSMFDGLAVVTCRSGRVMWQIGLTADASPPERVVYGVVPRGFTAAVPAHPLLPGCYHVYIAGPARATFTVSQKSTTTPDTAR